MKKNCQVNNQMRAEVSIVIFYETEFRVNNITRDRESASRKSE